MRLAVRRPRGAALRPSRGREAPAAAEPRGFGGTTSGARLAAATGGILRQEDADTETLVFPHPEGRAFAPAFALMREPDPAPPNDARSGAGSTSRLPSSRTPAQGGGGGGGGDIDEIYDQVIERLRRELLADRERMGDVLGDLP